jgi:hypothetical protein
VVNSRTEPQGAVRLAWLFFALFSLCLAYELFWRHPGVGAPEELFFLTRLQLASQGAALPWLFGRGSLYSRLLALSLKIGGEHLAALQFPNLLLFALESLLLWRLAKARWGGLAPLFAVLANLCCAFSFLRARTLFSYADTPALLLGMLWLLPRCRSWAAALAFGLACALALLDYEVWLLAPAILALAWLRQESASRPPLAPLLLGLSLGLGWVAFLSAPDLGRYASYRIHETLLDGGPWQNFSANLGACFLGWGKAVNGLVHQPTLPLLLLPLLLLGSLLALKKDGDLLSWAAVGLAPLASGGPFFEPNRAILAWPALVLLSALGLAWLWGKCLKPGAQGPWALATAGLFFLALFAAQALSYDRAVQSWDGRIYGPSRRQMAAADFLRRQGQGFELLDELGGKPMASFDFFLGPHALSDEPAWALIEGEDAPPTLPASWGEWREFRSAPDSAPLYLLRVAPAMRARLEAVNRALSALWLGMPDDPSLQLPWLESALKGMAGQDPWIRGATLEALVRLELNLGRLNAESVNALLQDELPSSAPLISCAAYFKDSHPDLALFLARRALERDPRRSAAWSLCADLEEKNGHSAQAAKLRHRLSLMPPGQVW